MVILGKVFGTILSKKIEKKLKSVVTKWEHKTVLFIYKGLSLVNKFNNSELGTLSNVDLDVHQHFQKHHLQNNLKKKRLFSF